MSSLLFVTLLATGGLLAAWKMESVKEADAASASQPEPIESVTAAVARPREHRQTVTAIGTVLATRSVKLRNELAGTVREVSLTPGQIVEAGTVLVRLDVSVEEAEMAAQKAQATLAQTLLDRNEKASQTHAVSASEVDRARAERDVALAQIARTQAIIERKTLRAPFRARVGLADVHRGQYLDAGAELTTLQGIDDTAHVDFAVPQRIAASLRRGSGVQVFVGGDETSIAGTIVAVDARVDPTTRNAMVRARIEDAVNGPAPGASVRVEVPDGPPRTAVVVPVSALRKGPAGDHVFVIAPDDDGKLRAHTRAVQTGAVLADEALIVHGLSAGERVAASGSFKLREAVLVAVADGAAAAGGGGSK
ncbi:MAG TPA: efflux RND transporter periplasmic adaptor subunit [Thermoanaerobaculia bacterium]|nr:efflux RND transporter periplasmic adaptor subunit [Thermoanaerobaculia bacterium]